MSTWRAEARRVIEEVLAEYGPDDDWEMVVDAIDNAYPFGSRDHYPYEAWLSERRHVIARLRGQPVSRGAAAEGPLAPPYVPEPGLDDWLRRQGLRSA